MKSTAVGPPGDAYAAKLYELEASAPQAAVDPSAEAVSPAGFGRAKEAALKTESDDALLERIAGNDQEAFRVLVERHIDRAYGLALRFSTIAPTPKTLSRTRC